VTRADQTITFPSPPTPTYGDPPVDVMPTDDSGLGLTNAASGACTGALVRLFLVGVGTCTLTSTQAGSFLYYPTTATTTFRVIPAVLTVVPDPVTGSMGAPLPTFGYHLTGFRNGDTASVTSGSATCTTTAGPSSFRGTYPVTCSVGTLAAANYVFAVAPPAVLTLLGPSTGVAAFGSDGSIFPIGPVPTVNGVAKSFFGSMAGQPLAAPVVGAAYTPLHDGYWLVAADGGIFAFGSARFAGSMGSKPLNRPIVGMAATPDGGGYWEVASDGGIFAFGDAGFYGSTGALTLVQPIVGMAATPDGRGYWLVAADGGIFAFGDAGFHGSTGGRSTVDPIVGMAATPDGSGYWMVTRAGAVFPFGDAPFEGSLRYVFIGAPIVGITPSSDGKGYWLAGSDGGVFAFGDAPFYGSVSQPSAPIVGII
jgi:MBG domain (YGX type)